ncbi:MAG: type I DNA topoisomerase, partial [Longimicrobiales bacterium]
MATPKNKHLVIVESPAKARTIGKYLGAGYRVRASVGHVRDLPERELGVDIEQGFEPRYVTIRGKGKVLQELRRDAEGVDHVLLATDPDREGEAIAYHVAEQLGYEPGKKVRGDGARFRRVLFHEITKDAVQNALEHPGVIDMRKVEAQQARRILDRLVGYQVSPLLWKPIRPGLSAGRVQTVALRLIAEREAEIRAFKAEEYWSITAHLEKSDKQFDAKLHQIDGKAFKLENEEAATAVLDDVRGVPFVITEIKRRERLKNPPAPFTTSTLQQEAAKRLGFSAQRTMRIAQQLYEGIDLGAEGAVGMITYMRTDSTRVSAGAAAAARALVQSSFGDRYVPNSPRLWGGKQQKGAQEAHEAIRPTDAARRPDDVRSFLERDQARLYELIWMRFVAGQMTPAVYDTTTVDFDFEAGKHRYLFRATGSILKFDGFTRLYQEAREEGDHRTLDDLMPLPDLEEGDGCTVLGIEPAQHFTQPPPRFTEASLVRELERLGIGRPSTYAQIISTLTDRQYVEVEQKRFHPTPLGETVANVLVRVFPDLFNVDFTSEMESELDRIEEGELGWRDVLHEFYEPFRRQLDEGASRSEAIVKEVVAGDVGNCPDCGRPLAVRWNKYGRFLGCSGYPECRYTASVDEKAKPEPKPTGEMCPRCGGVMVERQGRFGPFNACANYPKCKHTQPKTIPGLECPQCGEGDIGEKRTRRGKPFWGCTRYPDCDWSSWDRPVPTACPECTSPFLVARSTKARGDFLRCPNCKTEFTQAADGGV